MAIYNIVVKASHRISATSAASAVNNATLPILIPDLRPRWTHAHPDSHQHAPELRLT